MKSVVRKPSVSIVLRLITKIPNYVVAYLVDSERAMTRWHYDYC